MRQIIASNQSVNNNRSSNWMLLLRYQGSIKGTVRSQPLENVLERSSIAIDEHTSFSRSRSLAPAAATATASLAMGTIITLDSSVVALSTIIAIIIVIVSIVIVIDEAEMVRAARQLVLAREHTIEHRAALAPERLLARSECTIPHIDRKHSTRQQCSHGLVCTARL